MKNLPFLGLLFIAFQVSAQTSDQPFKKANTILIQTNMSPDSTFLLWGRHLAQCGFSIERSDKDFRSLTAGPKIKDMFDYFVISSIDDDGTIKLRLKWRMRSELVGKKGSEYYNWSYSSNNSTFDKSTYEDFKDVVAKFGEYPVAFKIE